MRRLKIGLLSWLLVGWSVACGVATGDVATGDVALDDATPLPGAEPFSGELLQALQRALAERGPGYEPRTEHLAPGGEPVYTNRLILEDSPYLLQHAHNPVNWFPWGEEAFAEARRRGVPIFLSIGYSTCHWCHVMEEESFDDADVARRMNESFVCVKVDREQRPDVDEVYMTALQLMGQRGGWPMSSFLTPEGDPFFGGTYFPRPQFLELLGQVSSVWSEQRPRVEQQARRVAEALRRATAASAQSSEVDEALLHEAVRQSLAQHDETQGGFSAAPKFPHEPQLLFLLGRALRGSDAGALEAVDSTLHHMARGGIYDQVGGGFHRYSTDAEWLVPHFEKMLYNQAHLARVYLEAWRLTGDDLHARVAHQTLDYVLRDMTAPEGGFYSATDADSEGHEGLFFVWTPDELRAALPKEDADLALKVFGVTDSGNFEGRNILHLPRTWRETASALGMSLDELLPAIDRIRARLYEEREEREHPLRDEKIVTAWNGMMITTLARASAELPDRGGRSRYLGAATKAAEFLWLKSRRHESRRDEGRLWRAVLDGQASVEATLGDYAYLAEALVTLYDVTEEPRYLERAAALMKTAESLFWDQTVGGFFVNEDDHGGRLPARPKSLADGAIPSGNSVALRVLSLLATRTGDSGFQRLAQESLAAFSGSLQESPTAYAYMLLAADQLMHGDAGPLEYGAGGVVRAEASRTDNEIRVRLDIADGWHVNSNAPRDDDLVATKLEIVGTGVGLADLQYPEADVVQLGFQDEPLAVFQGRRMLHGKVVGDVLGDRVQVMRLKLTIQACDDQKCLRPEALLMELP